MIWLTDAQYFENIAHLFRCDQPLKSTTQQFTFDFGGMLEQSLVTHFDTHIEQELPLRGKTRAQIFAHFSKLPEIDMRCNIRRARLIKDVAELMFAHSLNVSPKAGTP